MLRALKLGDLLTAVPALRALARAFPDHERLLATPAWLAPLVAHTGTVHAVVDTPSLDPPTSTFWPGSVAPQQHGSGPERAAPFWPGSVAAQRHGSGPERGSGEVDVAVNLHGRGPQSTALLESIRPRRLVAFGHGAGAPAWRDDEHEVARWCRLLSGCGIPADPADLRLDPPDVAVPAGVHGATVVHPGAASEARRWPAARWAAVARAEAGAGRPVVVTGGPDEVPLAREVAARAGLPDRAVVAGRTGLLELLAAVAAAGRVVCGDTGVAHVATAMGTPSVVLFGPVSPASWGPPDSPRHIALWAGRTGDPHADVPDAGLLEIAVADVSAALARLPEPASA